MEVRYESNFSVNKSGGVEETMGMRAIEEGLGSIWTAFHI